MMGLLLVVVGFQGLTLAALAYVLGFDGRLALRWPFCRSQGPHGHQCCRRRWHVGAHAVPGVVRWRSTPSGPVYLLDVVRDELEDERGRP